VVQWGQGQQDAATELQAWKKHNCEVCGKVLNGSREWESHLHSRRHRATVKRRNREARDGPPRRRI